MWRFILLTFGFLGFAFYELSGGADYEPAANSFQARSADKVDEPAAVTVVALEEPAAQQEPEVTRSDANLSDLAAVQDAQNSEERFEITLVSLQDADEYVPTVTAEPAQVDVAASAIDAAIEEAITEEDVIQQPVFSLETYAASADQSFVAATASEDLRQVSGNRVNMRSGPGTDFERVGSLTKGTDVIVIDEPGNGWVMLEVVETGETGWMADWLVTASN